MRKCMRVNRWPLTATTPTAPPPTTPTTAPPPPPPSPSTTITTTTHRTHHRTTTKTTTMRTIIDFKCARSVERQRRAREASVIDRSVKIVRLFPLLKLAHFIIYTHTLFLLLYAYTHTHIITIYLRYICCCIRFKFCSAREFARQKFNYTHTSSRALIPIWRQEKAATNFEQYTSIAKPKTEMPPEHTHTHACKTTK